MHNNNNKKKKKRNSAAVRFLPLVSPKVFCCVYLITKDFVVVKEWHGHVRKMFRSKVQKYDQQAKKLWTRERPTSTLSTRPIDSPHPLFFAFLSSS